MNTTEIIIVGSLRTKSKFSFVQTTEIAINNFVSTDYRQLPMLYRARNPFNPLP